MRGAEGYLEHLWELVLTADPLLVVAATPADSSAAVLAAMGSALLSDPPLLIPPDSYRRSRTRATTGAGAWWVCCLNARRPYFTIQDAELRRYTHARERLPAVLFGVTNPFFEQALKHFPTVVRVSHAVHRVGLSSASPAPRHAPFQSTTKQDLERDPVLLRALTKAATIDAKVDVLMDGGQCEYVQVEAVRRHFDALTKAFLNPLERYVTRLMPLRRMISPLKARGVEEVVFVTLAERTQTGALRST